MPAAQTQLDAKNRDVTIANLQGQIARADSDLASVVRQAANPLGVRVKLLQTP